ncbi:MAG: hypothetical protein AAGF86_14345 [Pseudomonadota bacterium]
MNAWHVSELSVEPLEEEDSKFFGINQTQAAANAKTAQGAFYVELWSQKKTKRLAVDVDRGLPSAESYEPHLTQARDIPATNLWVNCYCLEPGSEDRLADTWQEVGLPDAGWAGQMVVIRWTQA